MFVSLIKTLRKVKTQFVVTNRISRKSQILNSEELKRFWKTNLFNDYAIDTYILDKETVETNQFKNELFYGITGVALVILITKIIMLWI